MDDRRRIALQIRAIVVTYRIERRRGDPESLRQFRKRALDLLDSIADEASHLPMEKVALANVREELNRDGRSAGDAVGEESVDGPGELVDPERFR